jgi:hypothetical protein
MAAICSVLSTNSHAVLYSRRLNTQLEGFAQAGGNEVCFRSLPQQFQRGRFDISKEKMDIQTPGHSEMISPTVTPRGFYVERRVRGAAVLIPDVSLPRYRF